jgi:hypothetical protein
MTIKMIATSPTKAEQPAKQTAGDKRAPVSGHSRKYSMMKKLHDIIFVLFLFIIKYIFTQTFIQCHNDQKLDTINSPLFLSVLSYVDLHKMGLQKRRLRAFDNAGEFINHIY